jgi:hypothetical protein
VTAFLATALLVAAVQAPNPGAPSPEKFGVVERRGQKAPMRDGVALALDLYLPDAPGPHPAILVHTPYDRKGPGRRAAAFARRGYAVAVSDVRGRCDSEGQWDPFDARHKTDGHDLVEWLASQPWCAGRVGMMGGSYLGWTQWWTATQAPPSLKAIVPEVAPPDPFFNAPYQNGVLVGWAMDWAGMMSGRRIQPIGKGGYGGFTPTRGEDLLTLPALALNGRRGSPKTAWFDTWIRENLASAKYWRGISYQRPEDYSKITVPTLNVTGWFDANFPGAPLNYRGMKEHGPNPAARRPSLVIGPWSHGFNRDRRLLGVDYGPEAVIDWDGYVCRWFDHFLKGVDNGVVRDPPVHLFVMGRNRWVAEKDWPVPGARPVAYYLRGGGKARSLAGDGVLSRTPPGDEPPDEYVYDPSNPTPSAMTGDHIHGADDTRASAAREDVLVYTSPPLEEDVEVTGPVRAKLFASTSARDTDWMVRLVDVLPDGTSALLCDGVLRARCRDPLRAGAFNPARLSAIEPDQVYEYTIDFWRATSNLFRKGHRIRVEVSSAYFPYYLRNLNSGADNVGLESKPIVARQKVHHTAAYPSHVVLPVVERRD